MGLVFKAGSGTASNCVFAIVQFEAKIRGESMANLFSKREIADEFRKKLGNI